ncbi:nicotinamide riboside transporter PnuC [Paraburkholderia sp. D15]|uniref:nicotinamide riboside transporter PnuC n=1 Tax=Paraburkholderia sp. D15 TaxID=2880218 RepID=UPI00247A0856|nr:nicotinamide riboside transporter PnuC [Paraburkholderia sp. D15]WGS51692.1 nicotinamide riboside transporter PnuC [Paraburkholderia sp. D15]
MSALEITGVIVSALAIWLTARRYMSCWPVGLASVALYGWIFYDAKLYSDMLLQGAFALLQVYGWWRWIAQRSQADGKARRVDAQRPGSEHGGQAHPAEDEGAFASVSVSATDTDTGAVKVRVVPLRALLPGFAFALVCSAALGSLMAHFTDAALPYVDATLTSFSLVAQYWTARRYIASWWVWSVVNVVYVGMFLFKGLYPTAGLYALFIGLAVIGWRDWSRAIGRDDAQAARGEAAAL